MNIQMKHLISGCVLLVAGLTACSDDTVERFPVKSGDAVRFAASSASTRTIYDDENIFQINWENQDHIRIYSNKDHEGVADADYTVTPSKTDDSNNTSNKLYNKGTIAASDDSHQLMWADNGEHTFIGVYPSDVAGILIDKENNVVTFPVNRDQRCEAVPVSEDAYYSEKYKGYTYYAKPDMKNAYLVAYNTLTPEEAAANNGEVFLNFKPVMTTIEVVVKGSSNANTDIQVTGISLRRELPSKFQDDYGFFRWNAQKGELVLDEKPTDATTVENTMVTLKDAVTLHGPQTIVFTVFIPPLEVNATYPIKIRVHATGAAEVVTKDITNEILASNKRRVTLTNFLEKDSTNNWITPLDDDIYVSQMSIPGSHDAATGENKSSVGKTQDNKLQDQWDLGVRCYDMRPSMDESELWIWHGLLRTDIKWENALNILKNNLVNHPGEFAIVLFRHEDDRFIDSEKPKKNAEFDKSMTDWVNLNKDIIVEWKPGLTIGECRGKIILISRFLGTWKYGTFTGWSHDDITKSPAQTQTIYNAQGTERGSIYVQDHYDFSDYETKYQEITIMLDIAADFHTNNAHKNIWMINHISGYKSSLIPSSDDYRKNAAAQNLDVYNYLQKRTGTTGITLFDYSGVKNSIGLWGQTIKVNGDIILQAVIDNNYKYRMKRKGE